MTKEKDHRADRTQESRLSVVSIIVENPERVSDVNDLLHEFAEHIQGRLGVPCKDRGVSIICVVLDAPGDVVSALSGKLGMLDEVLAKTIVSKMRPGKDLAE